MADNRGQTLENKNQMVYLYNQSTDRTEGAERSDFSSVFCHLPSVISTLNLNISLHKGQQSPPEI